MSKNGKKNKKGNLALSFFITIILALIIFVPACYLGGRLFSTSTQAKDNYVDFVGELNEFYKKAELGTRKSTLMIMDKGTAMVYFEQGKKEVLVEVDARLPYPDYRIFLQKPSQCENEKNCLCLFRKSEFEMKSEGLNSSIDVESLQLIHLVIVLPKRVLCTNLNYNLEVESCSIGEPEAVHSYKCSNGFMIERYLADESSWSVFSYYKNPRRTVLYLTKLDQTIRIQG